MYTNGHPSRSVLSPWTIDQPFPLTGIPWLIRYAAIKHFVSDISGDHLRSFFTLAPVSARTYTMPNTIYYVTGTAIIFFLSDKSICFGST